MIRFATNDKKLAVAIAEAESGDIIELSGQFGDILIQGGDYPKVQVGSETILGKPKDPLDTIIIRSRSSIARAEVKSIRVKDSDCWRFENLDVFPGHKAFPYIAVDTDGAYCSVVNCYVSFGYGRRWTKEEWLANAGDGIIMRGPWSQIVDCTIDSVATGFQFRDNAEDSVAEGNKVRYYWRDGFRGTVDSCNFRNNSVSYAVKVDDNHDDGCQFWEEGKGSSGDDGRISGICLTNNVIDGRTWDNPLATTPHGISFFKVTAVDCLIENNEVFVDHWNGIVVEKAEGTVVRGNKVSNPDNTTRRIASIRVKGDEHTVVKQNIAGRIQCSNEVIQEDNVDTAL